MLSQDMTVLVSGESIMTELITDTPNMRETILECDLVGINPHAINLMISIMHKLQLSALRIIPVLDMCDRY